MKNKGEKKCRAKPIHYNPEHLPNIWASRSTSAPPKVLVGKMKSSVRLGSLRSTRSNSAVQDLALAPLSISINFESNPKQNN
jgi:hypothetical protein